MCTNASLSVLLPRPCTLCIVNAQSTACDAGPGFDHVLRLNFFFSFILYSHTLVVGLHGLSLRFTFLSHAVNRSCDLLPRELRKCHVHSCPICPFLVEIRFQSCFQSNPVKFSKHFRPFPPGYGESRPQLIQLRDYTTERRVQVSKVSQTSYRVLSFALVPGARCCVMP